MFAVVAWSAGPWQLPAPFEPAILVTLLREAAGEGTPSAAPAPAPQEAEPAAARPVPVEPAPPPKRAAAKSPAPRARAEAARAPAPSASAPEAAPSQGAAESAPAATEGAPGAPAGAEAPPAVPVDADRVYGEGEVDRAAAPLGGIRRPEYPARERMMGREGRVSLRVTVDAAGAVREVAVARSAGAALDAAARRAVERTRFRPARREGRAVASTVTVNVAFELD